MTATSVPSARPTKRHGMTAVRRTIGGLRRQSVLAPLLLLTFLVAVALLADLLRLPNPRAADLQFALRPPFQMPTHPLGTDGIGRDMLARLAYGTRISLTVGFASVGVALIIGSALGLLAGYSRGRVEIVIMRLADVQLSLPSFVLALTIMTVFGAGELNVILALSIGGWVRFARVVRSSVLPLHDADYIVAARSLGCGYVRVIGRHILPNVVSPIIVIATLAIGATIISESSLSFLGLGVDPQTPSWGGMLANGRDYLETAWWVAALPGIAISLTVLATNIVGDWLRDALDPRMRSR